MRTGQGGGGAGPAVVLSDDFTGSDGAGWNPAKWTTTANDSTKTVDLQSNQGRLHVDGDTARATAQMEPIGDQEATFTYRFSDRDAGSQLRVFLRGSRRVDIGVTRDEWPVTAGVF